MLTMSKNKLNENDSDSDSDSKENDADGDHGKKNILLTIYFILLILLFLKNLFYLQKSYLT